MDAAGLRETVPVFVDASGRRRRGLSVLGYLGASASVAYLAAFGLTVTSTGGAIDAATGVPLAPTPVVDEGDGGDDGGADVPAETVVATAPARTRVADAAVTRSVPRSVRQGSDATPRPASSGRHRATDAVAPAAPVVHRVTRSSLVTVHVVAHTARPTPVVTTPRASGQHRACAGTHRPHHQGHQGHHHPRHAAPAQHGSQHGSQHGAQHGTQHRTEHGTQQGTQHGTHAAAASGGPTVDAAGADILATGA